MFEERLSALPEFLVDFKPAPPASDRAAWLGLPAEVRAALVADGEAAAARAFPTLPATLYLDYSRTGDRQRFEASYFGRRRLLNSLALAECVEGEGRLVANIIDGLVLLCEESGWQLPAHNAQQRGGRRDPLPDPERPVVDLFAAETGAQLAVIAALLGPELEAGAPGILARIDLELERRVFLPYLTRGFWWMGRDGDGPTNNWTAWCTQNVLLAAFCRPLGQSRRREILSRAAASLDAFLAGYGDDGACAEGPLYYRHAGLCLFVSMLVLDGVAPKAFAPLWSEPKFRNIAEYLLKVHAAGRYYVNFGDCSAVLDGCGAREFLFGRAVRSKRLADFAAADWQRDRRATLPDEINTFTRAQLAFTVQTLATHVPEPVQAPSGFLGSIGLFVARDDRFVLAVQAGHNGDGHGHNDVGNLIVYKDGRPLLIDVGVESYSAKTFSSERYDIWTMQSAWHNLPSFDGVMQREGERFSARDVETAFTPDFDEIAMDVAAAYPPEAGLERYTRRIRLAHGKSVELWDDHAGAKAAVLSLMFSVEPAIRGSAIRLPGLAEIAIDGSGSLAVETIPVADPRLRRAWPERLYRVLVPLIGGSLHLRIV